jgi:hypothetical protein
MVDEGFGAVGAGEAEAEVVGEDADNGEVAAEVGFGAVTVGGVEVVGVVVHPKERERIRHMVKMI